MITNFLVLPQNFIKLKIELSFSAVELPLKESMYLELKTFIETKCANME